MKYIEGVKVNIKSWCDNPEEGALKQAIELSSLPFIFNSVCLMPDTHQGYGMPIGGVIATEGVVIPNAVGVDIGCGMCAVKTDIAIEDMTTDMLKKILGGSKEYKGGIRSNIPIGFSHHKKAQDWSGFDYCPDIEILKQELIEEGCAGFENFMYDCECDIDNIMHCEGKLGFDCCEKVKQ